MQHANGEEFLVQSFGIALDLDLIELEGEGTRQSAEENLKEIVVEVTFTLRFRCACNL